ncbi:MAG: ATP-dependent zinc metalloprotease FtsH [Rhizobacter sp.]|nr:ATP-dependent zinc metalloprotease FtsH [Chlorobiales bacterium]
MANFFDNFGGGDDDGAKKKKNEKENKPRFTVIYYVMAILILVGMNFVWLASSSAPELPYSQFRKLIDQDKIEYVELSPSRVRFIVKKDVPIEDILPNPAQRQAPPSFFRSRGDGREYFSVAVRDEKLTEVLDTKQVRYKGVSDETWFGNLLQYLLPVALIIGVYLFIFRRMNPNSQVMNIGKNKAALYENPDDATKITFKDVAGLEEAKEEVMEIVEFLRDPKKFTKLGGKLPKGVLLVGPPGAGKTLMAKAVAGEAQVPFFSLSGSDFVEMFVGVGAARVRDLFKQAKEKAPCIIFIDEIDAVGRSRGKGMMMGVNDERENTLNQLLVEMDGFATDKGVIMMAATNRPDVLDAALLRPGRFDRQIVIDKPDMNGRIQIFKVHTKNMPLSANVDLKVLASQTPGFAGAEIANVANEAALLASRRSKEIIEMIDFQDAIERVIGGLEKRNKVINPKERRIVAFHESGHAIVSWMLTSNDPVQKVSIVPRGVGALGYTLNMPLEDRYLMTKEELFERICGLLGGRVAEEIVFGRISTGAQNDLERVTNIAYNMVAVYGMSERLGYLSFADTSNQYLTGVSMDKRYGEDTAKIIDEEVKRLIDDAHQTTKQVLLDHRTQLDQMAGDLLKKEVLDYKGIEEILGKRPNLDDSNTNIDLTVAEVGEVKAGDEDERKALEAAVEKLKTQRQAGQGN